MVDNYGTRAKTKLPFGLNGGLKKLVTLPLCRFHKCHQAVLYVTQHCQERISRILGTLSKDVFERRTSTGSEAFSLFICLDANKLVLLSFFFLLKTIYPRVSTKPLPNDAKSPLFRLTSVAQKRCRLSSLL